MSGIAKNAEYHQGLVNKTTKQDEIPTFTRPAASMAAQNVVAMHHNKAVIKRHSTAEMDVVKKKFGMTKASEDEIAFCFGVAQQLGLNPLINQIYFVQRSSLNPETNQYESKFEPMVSRDGLHAIATRTGNFAGMHVTLELKDSFTLTTSGKWEMEPDLVATCIVKMMTPHGVVLTEVSVCYKEYVQKTKEGKPTKFWTDKPQTMLKKVAESQALRKACNISGVYSVEEMGVGEEIGGQLMLDTNTIQTVADKLEAVFKKIGFKVSSNGETFYLEGEVGEREGVRNLLNAYGFSQVDGEKGLFMSQNAYNLVISGVAIEEFEASTIVETQALPTPEDEGTSEPGGNTYSGSETPNNQETSMNPEASAEYLRQMIHALGIPTDVETTTEGITVVATGKETYAKRKELASLGLTFNTPKKAWMKTFPF